MLDLCLLRDDALTCYLLILLCKRIGVPVLLGPVSTPFVYVANGARESPASPSSLGAHLDLPQVLPQVRVLYVLKRNRQRTSVAQLLFHGHTHKRTRAGHLFSLDICLRKECRLCTGPLTGALSARPLVTTSERVPRKYHPSHSSAMNLCLRRESTVFVVAPNPLFSRRSPVPRPLHIIAAIAPS